MQINIKVLIFIAMVPVFVKHGLVQAEQSWLQTEVQYRQGALDEAYIGGKTFTRTYTLQQAHGWQYGDNFYFLDFIHADDNHDYYGELYANVSLNKTLGLLSGAEQSGWIRDVGITYGFNVAGDAKSRKHLPGIRLDWSIPGFTFLNTLLTAYIDDTDGSVVPKEDDSYMIDVAWDYPFQIRNQYFLFTGHSEYIHQRDNEYGQKVYSWFLTQAQFRYDVGRVVLNRDNKLWLGVEYKLWNNKLGDKNTDERVTQLLLVWRL